MADFSDSNCVKYCKGGISMKILRIVMVLFSVFAAGTMVARSSEQPEELSGFTAVPATIKPGVATVFTFVFNVPMDTSEDLNLSFELPDDSELTLPAYWDGQNTCKLSYSFPNINESGTAEITVAGAKTLDGKDIGDINVSVEVVPGTKPVDRMK
jgi:hypothetical protein